MLEDDCASLFMSISSVAQYINNSDAVTIVLGAGASRSAGIPTAPELVKIINQKFGYCLGGLSEKELANYGAVMGKLSPDQRKSLIEPLLKEAKLNWGHIALAAIIASGKVRRILTFNFDLILEKTTALLGMHLPVYDFGVSPTRDVAKLASPAIFHLHGQSYGLRLLNSAAETEKHAREIRPLLADSLRNHVTVVVGYSGESDPAFTVMADEYDSNCNLFWLGFEKERKPHLAPLLDKDFARYVGGCDFDRSMMEIAKAVGAWPPQIFKNPPRHVLKVIENVAPFPVQLDTERDVLTETRHRLADAAEAWESGKSSLERTQSALLEGIEPEPVEDENSLSEEEREARAWSYVAAARKLVEKSTDMPENFRKDNFVEAYKNLSQALRLSPDMSHALHLWGWALSEEACRLEGQSRASKFSEACAKYTEALCITPNDDDLLENFAGAFVDQALSTGERNTAALTEAKKLGLRCKEIRGGGVFNLACIFALLGETEAALSELESCLASKTLPRVDHLESDADLSSLRGHERFEKLLKAAGKFQ